MTKSEEFNQLWGKANSGKSGFQCIVWGQNGPNYLFEGQQGKVDSVELAIWNDRQVYVSQAWEKSKPVAADKRWFAVAKDSEKFMVALEKVGIFSFGTERDRVEKCKAILHVQCGCISTLIMAVNDPPMLVIHDYVQDDADPLSAILADLFVHLPTHCQGEEVTTSAGEDGPTADVDLGK